MKCPACENSLSQYKYHDITVDICPACKGIWFDPDELRGYVEYLLRDNKNIPYAKVGFTNGIVNPDSLKEAPRVCPRCEKAMVKFNYLYDSNVILDRCTSCGGVWTDGDELQKLAIYVKGNPDMRAVAAGMMNDFRKDKDLQDLAELGKALTTSSGPAMFMPKIILPLTAEREAETFPGVTLGIIVINALIFLLEIFLGNDVGYFVGRFGFIPSEILSGKGIYTFMTSVFLHGGIMHIFGNMLFLWIFAKNIEDSLGHLRFACYYLLFGIFASMLYFIVNPHSNIPAIGASGAISGIMGAFIIMFPKSKIRTLFIVKIINIPAYIYIGTWIIFQIIYGMVDYNDGFQSGIGWFAHIGGFASGVIMMWFYKRKRDKLEKFQEACRHE